MWDVIFQSIWQDPAKDLILLQMIKKAFRTAALAVVSFYGCQGTVALAVLTALHCLLVAWLSYSKPLSAVQCLWNIKILKICSCSIFKQVLGLFILWLDLCLTSFFWLSCVYVPVHDWGMDLHQKESEHGFITLEKWMYLQTNAKFSMIVSLIWTLLGFKLKSQSWYLLCVTLFILNFLILTPAILQFSMSLVGDKLVQNCWFSIYAYSFCDALQL